MKSVMKLLGIGVSGVVLLVVSMGLAVVVYASSASTTCLGPRHP